MGNPLIQSRILEDEEEKEKTNNFSCRSYIVK
jgi:hypothetical protein